MTVDLAEIAENANTFTPLGPQHERIVDDRYVLWMGATGAPWSNSAQRFRLQGDEIDEVRAEIHDRLRAKGRHCCTWEIGTHATPGDLVDRLLARGLVDDATPLAVGMVLTEPPRGEPPTDIDVRPARTHDERLAAERIAAIGFGEPASDFVPPLDPTGNNVVYLAFADGEPVARASGSFGPYGATLFGGATLPEARGRGAYRALVWARWNEAVERGTPGLVTQASPMSRPILTGLGFREVCEIRVLLDEFGAAA